MSLSPSVPSYPELESFTIYREGRHDPTPRPCSDMYLFDDKNVIPDLTKLINSQYRRAMSGLDSL